ncbi:MAG: hypothetical protein LBD50_00820, partial [Rickettsiales bacterium]|nr:hypothetical protein [Rickettsiales bacterium]
MKRILLVSVIISIIGIAADGYAGQFQAIKHRSGITNLGEGLNSNEYFFAIDKHVFECDDDQGDVDNGVFLYYTSDGVTIKAKQCVIERSGDFFKQVNIGWCNDKNSCSGKKLEMGERSVCVSSGDVRKIGDTGFSNGPSIGCIFNTVPDKNPVKEEPGSSSASNPTSSGGISSLQNCLNARASSEGKACCYVPSSIAYWNGSSCVCLAADTKFDANSRQCMPNIKTPAPLDSEFICSDGKIAELREKKSGECSHETTVISAIDQILEYCKPENAGKRNEYQFKNFISEYERLEKICKDKLNEQTAKESALARQEEERRQEEARQKAEKEEAALKVKIDDSIATIKSAYKNIQDIQTGFDSSVWKDAEGKFNTSRLISDSVAGVVLGTAGGLITSNVIKKNQVKGGFEDISCSVGGQVVAG